MPLRMQRIKEKLEISLKLYEDTIGSKYLQPRNTIMSDFK